jgi:hypothetical protein
MELHRKGGDRRLSLVGIVYGGASLVVGGVFALLGSWAIALVVWVSGGFFLLLGLYLLLTAARRFQVTLTESGLVVHANGHHFQGPWSQVEAIYIQQSAPFGNPPRTWPILVLWVVDGVPMRRRATEPHPHTGRKGYRIAEVDQLQESHDDIAAALHRYAGEKFRALPA